MLDFTDGIIPIYTDPVLDEAPMKVLETSPTVYGLWAWNTNLSIDTDDFPPGYSFIIKYNGVYNDRNAILTLLGAPLNIINGYHIEDVNLNGQVKYSGLNNDRVIILNNVGFTTPLNTISQHSPN